MTTPDARTRDIETGRKCYARKDWADAYDALSRADALAPLGAADLELLAWSASLRDRDEPLPTERNHGGGAAADGLFYAIAGRHNWNEATGAVADVSAFDPADGTWTERAPIPSARSEIGASTSTLSDGRILVILRLAAGNHAERRRLSLRPQ